MRLARWGWTLALMAAVSSIQAESPVTNTAPRTVLVVAGAPGLPEYAGEFNHAVTNWMKAAQQAGARSVALGFPARVSADADGKGGAEEGDTVRSRLEQALAAEPKEGHELWLVLIGHGTFDGRQAKFNLEGPDVASSELAEWLKPFRRRIAVINAAAASAPFINALSASNRLVITATRSGNEQNYARFGRLFSEAVADAASDVDKDGQTSLLEAFLSASKRTAEFYKNEGRLATEHALLDDNGDGLGTQADWFKGVRAVKKANQATAVDGQFAHQFHLLQSPDEARLTPEQRSRRDAIEKEIEQLRGEKGILAGEDYYRRLENLLLELSRIYGLTGESAPAPATNR